MCCVCAKAGQGNNNCVFNDRIGANRGKCKTCGTSWFTSMAKAAGIDLDQENSAAPAKGPSDEFRAAVRKCYAYAKK